jgi:glutamate 5-kinase
MVTKLIAAELATSVGCRMIITLGSKPKILEILNHLKGNENSTTYEPEFGTHFIPAKTPLNGRKRWITHGLVSSGTIWIDQGAKEAITGKAKSSLFSAGIVEVEGNFYAQQCVSIKMKEVTNEDGKMIEKISDVGRGISSYSGADLQKIKGCSSSMIEDVLGYMSSEYVIHRDNLAIL